MLEKLDTLIAFAVVMLGISLIITILTQIISTALGLRGANLLWGIERLLSQLDPALAVPPVGAAPGVPSQALSLAKEILQHDLISDSTFSRLGNMKIIGPLVQHLSSWPLIGTMIDRWRLATAIRPEELARMIEQKRAALVTAAGAAAPPALANQLANLLQAADEEAIRKLAMLRDALRMVNPAAPPPPAAIPNVAVSLDKAVQQVTDAGEAAIGKLETWFSSTMDRVSQRFVLQVRLWTILFAFLLAFGFHVDSLRLLDQLSTNPDTRAALVNLRDGMLSDAKLILPLAAAPAAGAAELPVSTGILQEALDRLKKTTPKVPPNQQIGPEITTVKQVQEWLTQTLSLPQAAADEYRRDVIAVLRDHADSINKNLAKAGFQLIPAPFPKPIWKYDDKRNVLGILLAAAFLSLGAPFWYNALKNLSNLRTVVASKEQQESSGA